MVKPSLTTVDVVANSSISVEQSATSPSVSVVHAWIVCDALDDHGAFEKLVLSHGIVRDCFAEQFYCTKRYKSFN